jgi:hypothetical protein
VDGFAEFGPDAQFHGADALGDVDVDDEWDEDWNYDDGGDALDDFGAFGVEGEGGGFLRKAVTAAVAAGLAGVIGGVGKKLVQGRGRGGEMDVEVDLEPRGGSASDVRVDQDYLAARREGHAGGAYGGEMEVEVELERPYTGAYRAPSEYGAGRGQYGRELEVEVEMEQPRRYAGAYEAPRGRGLPVSPLAGAVAAGAAALVGGLVARLVHNRSHGGEMDVEVELEQRGGQTGFTSSPQPLRAEREYEVELERPGGATASGSTGTTGSTGSGPADPPLM